MNRKTTFLLNCVIVLAAVAVNMLAYPKLPEKMASHWGPGGQVDGWMCKRICVWLIPAIMVFQTSLFFGILLIDPLRKNIKQFFIFSDNTFIICFDEVSIIYMKTC